jgi:poly(3-hydroxybutyrate) depolymerase
MRVLAFPFLLFGCHVLQAQESTTVQLKTATGHPMQYYISLPEGWTAAKKWPVLVSCEAAEKEFRANAERFVQARKHLPFIIVVPLITTNGNYGSHDPKIYPYSKATWDLIDKVSTCTFDLEGLDAVLYDVQNQYSGDPNVFLTGFEAGTHLVWAYTFRHPERLQAVAVVGGNYINRCIQPEVFSTNATRKNLPIRSFFGAQDSLFGKHSRLYYQFENARKQGQEHGFTNITETEIPGKGHMPLPEEVVGYFRGVGGW